MVNQWSELGSEPVMLFLVELYNMRSDTCTELQEPTGLVVRSLNSRNGQDLLFAR
jgi:hypothetical protein